MFGMDGSFDNTKFLAMGEPKPNRIAVKHGPIHIKYVNGIETAEGQDVKDMVIKRNNYIEVMKFTGVTDGKRYRVISSVDIIDRVK
jgi:hypothetical protein